MERYIWIRSKTKPFTYYTHETDRLMVYQRFPEGSRWPYYEVHCDKTYRGRTSHLGEAKELAEQCLMKQEETG